jgi:transcriptional regulator with XRE-family HTH domain
MLSEFGVFLKILMVDKGDITQYALGKELGCSASMISNIITGKTSPNFAFLVRCREYFGLKGKDVVDMFRTAFHSSDSIDIDMSYFPEKGKAHIADILAPLLLHPEIGFYDKIKRA